MQLPSISLREVLWLICKVTEIDPLARKLQLGRIISNLHLRINFICTLLSCAKSQDKVLLNFEPEDIKVNESSLDEMFQIRNESLFSGQHPSIEFSGISMCLFNITSWNLHLKHFLCDKMYSTYSSLFCFTETNVNDSPAKHIDEILDD